MKARIFFLFLIFSSIFVYGSDDDPLKTLLSKLERLRRGFPQEKVHLHLDKPYYSIGDTIWFKAYVVNAEQHQLSDLSKILYVELINEKDSIKQSIKLPLISGLIWGDFTLTDTLKEGNYRIRAYTNWMRNFSDEYFFDKTIRIGNALSNNVVTNANYIFSKEGNNEKVLANIAYTELDGTPLRNKEVTYNVQLDFRNIANGKGITDENGMLKINFVNNQPFILKSGKITTNLKLDEKVFVSKIIPVKATTDEIKIQFFPESGQLVNNIPSKIAFKALKADGLGADISGYVIDKDNNKVADLKTDYAGMGVFTLQPLSDNSYKAIVKINAGSEKTFDLPKAVREGYLLAINNKGTDSIEIKIGVSPEMLNSSGEITLVAQANNIIEYVSKNKLTSSVLSTVLPKKRFSTGILQLTLFAGDTQPVAERLVFIQHNDQLKIAVSSNKPAYIKQEKVKMTVHVTDANDKPVQGNFSMAVTDERVLPYDELYETTILSNLLLSSDLKGYIETPNYYFSDITKEKISQLDNLMLTQGWRRFLWKNLLSDSYPSLTFVPEQTVEINGRVVTKDQVPVAGAKVTLLASSGNGTGTDVFTDSEGRFRYTNLVFNDSTKFVIQARDKNGKSNVDIELSYNRPPMVTKNKNTTDVEVNVNQSLFAYLQDKVKQFAELRRNGFLKKGIMLSEVKITDKKPEVLHSSNLNGPGNADAIVKGDQLTNCMNLAQCLPGKLLGLSIRNGVAYLSRYQSGGPMLLIVDGVPVDPQVLSSIDPKIVETVELLKNGGSLAVYGVRGGNGVLIVTTKRAELAAARPKPGILSYAPQGYYLSRTFYSPDYDNPATKKTMADLRTTVYWNPTVVTDLNGNATVEFFNAGGTGSYKAVLEGINAEGKLGRQIYRYTVQ